MPGKRGFGEVDRGWPGCFPRRNLAAMLKLLLRVALAFLVLIVLLVLAGFLVPATYRVTRTATIQAPPAAVHALAGDLRSWLAWTAWSTNRFPDMRVTLSPETTGPGAFWAWEGVSSGVGRLTITRSEPEAGVWYDLDFSHGKFLSKGSLALAADGPATAVTWTQEGHLGWNPVNRWFGLLMDRFIGADFERGLEGLRAAAEQAAK